MYYTGPITLCLGPCSTVPLLTFASGLAFFLSLFRTHAFFRAKSLSLSPYQPFQLLIQLSKPQVVLGQVTKASSWDKPECLKNADEKLNTTSWKERLAMTKH